MDKYNVRLIDENLKTHNLKPVWASNPHSALNIAATRIYGPYGWDIVCDTTVMGEHVRHRGTPTECIELF